MKITYAITVCDELIELQRLVEILGRHARDQDEIVIQYDEPNASQEVVNYLKDLRRLEKCAVVAPFALNGDFATFKNNLKNISRGDYIFQIDADGYPTESLLSSVQKTLELRLRTH